MTGSTGRSSTPTRNDKRIIGVWAPGSAGCEVPEPLEKYADAIVGWNSEGNPWRPSTVPDPSKTPTVNPGLRSQVDRIGC